ncbi:MAG TPA: MASE1 domain-containing protein [Actinomycetota bacterium]|nr:MASE1 domain-containing protein [Actinomycetota bacterium]
MGSFLADVRVRVLLLAAVYFVAAKLGLQLAIDPGNATILWAPTGISLAALMLFGPRLWPGVAIGAFAANATTEISILAAAAIAIGNTLEAVVGAALLRRMGFVTGIDRLRDVGALVVAALVSTTISATVGAGTLWVSGAAEFSDLDAQWTVWWVGDVMGDLLVAPLLLVWLGRPLGPVAPRRMAEAVALGVALAGLGWTAFVDANIVTSYIALPLLIWAALRFRQHGAVSAIFLFAGLGVWATLTGERPFGGDNVVEAVGILQAVMSANAIGTLALAATLAERQKADELKDTFMHMVVHDLRGPVMALVGMSTALKDRFEQIDPEQRSSYLQTLTRASMRLSRLLDSVLFRSQIEQGKLQVRMTPTAVEPVLTEVLAELGLEHVDVSCPTAVAASVDRRHLEHILLNYLTNARKYGRPPISVDVSARDRWVQIRVSDSGSGVAQEFVAQLFERFTRGEETGEETGTGLGLAIVGELARAHGGVAWYEPNEPSGSCFFVRLPEAEGSGAPRERAAAAGALSLL